MIGASYPTQEQPTGWFGSFFQSGIQGPQAAPPPQITSFAKSVQEAPQGHPTGFFGFGVRGATVANPSSIGSIFLRQEQPIGLPAAGFQFFNPGVQGPNVTVPINNTGRVVQVVAPISNGPFVHAFPITPSDVTVFPVPTRGVWVGGTGTLIVLMNGDVWPSFVTFTAIPAGTMLGISIVKVLPGSTATAILGLY